MKTGDLVRLLCVPAVVIADRDRSPETCEILKKAVGREFVVRGENTVGMAELWICEDGMNSSNACDDSLFVESEYLTVLS